MHIQFKKIVHKLFTIGRSQYHFHRGSQFLFIQLLLYHKLKIQIDELIADDGEHTYRDGQNAQIAWVESEGMLFYVSVAELKSVF